VADLGNGLFMRHKLQLGCPIPVSRRGCLEPARRRLDGRDKASAELAAELITEVCRDRQIDPRGLVLRSDKGKPMRGITMVSTLQWLSVVPSFSRPRVSDDNPYSESLFRTLKNACIPAAAVRRRPGSSTMGRAFCRLV
jgi:transposase InsO family protein